jgi:hypothetical protein
MKSAIVIAFLLLVSMGGYAQQLDLQAGTRSGVSNGLTCRILTGPDTYTEGMLLSRNRGVQLYVLRGQTLKLSKIPMEGFSYSSGWGGHVGFAGSRLWNRDEYYHRNALMPVLGIDYYMALNFTFRNFLSHCRLIINLLRKLFPTVYCG